MLTPRLILITALDVVPAPVLFDRIRAAGALDPVLRTRVAVQLRDPELSGRALFELGARVREATRASGISLIVNDRLDLALALGADGVHLGRRSVSVADARALLGASTWVTVSCHAVSEIHRAAADGADAALLSPIFPSPGKGSPLGVDALRASTSTGRALPVIALGGVDEGRAAACFEAGAHGVAAIRADLADLARTLVSTLASHLAT